MKSRFNPNILLAANVAMLNDNTRFFAKESDNAPHGVVLAANDANFDAAHFSEPLTEMVIDFPDAEGLDTLLENAFPSVPVGRGFEYWTHDSTEAFQAALNNEDIREIGGDFAEIRLTGTKVDGRTDNKGLTIVLDNDQGGEDPAVQQAAVLNLKNRLLRSELYRSNVLLDANDTASGSINWKTAGSDPDGDILSNIDLSGDARGINANTVLYGGGAWVKRYLGLGVDANSGKFGSRSLTPQQLAPLLGVDQVLISNFRYQSSATAKTKVIADNIWIYYVKKGASTSDPSNFKRFVTSVPGGGMFRVYVTPLVKRTKISVEHYSRIACTSTLGIRKQPVTFS